MDFTPIQWLKIGLANALGHDKLTFEERLGMLKFGLQPTEDGFIPTMDVSQAEEPAYAQAMLNGLQGNARVRVHLDATASGTQILAAFANCRKSGTHCNLFGEARQDAYTNAWKAMGDLPGVTRKLFKEAFMTASFGSRKVPRENLGEENLSTFYTMFQEEFPGVWNVLRYLEGLWQTSVHSHRWTMPDGFEVIQWNTGLQEETVTLFGESVTVLKQVHITKSRGISLLANTVHSVDGLLCREMVKRAQFNPTEAQDTIDYGFMEDDVPHEDLEGLLYLYRKTQFLSVDLIQAMNAETYTEHLDETEALEIHMLLEHLANKQQFYLLPVHDAFSCEARYCNDVCDMYRYLMQQLWDSELLNSIAEDITGKRESHKKYPAILDGVHMVC